MKGVKMRPIKFRAWNIEEKAWCPAVRLFEAFSWLSSATQTVFFDPERADGLIVEQFTGVLDNNGKEIIEGDILNAGQWYGKAVVIWSCGGFKMRALESNGVKQAGFASNAKTMEVIGNIHENPELLTV